MKVGGFVEGPTPVTVLPNDVGAGVVKSRVVGEASDVCAGMLIFGKGGTEGMRVAVVTTPLSTVVPRRGLVAGPVADEKDTVGSNAVVVLTPTLTEVPMIGIDVMTVALAVDVKVAEAVRVALLLAIEDEAPGSEVKLVASTCVDDLPGAVVGTVPLNVADVGVLDTV